MKNTLGLQIGNLVTIQNQYFQTISGKKLEIKAIYENGFLGLELILNKEVIRTTQKVDFVQPISITPETIALFEQFGNQYNCNIGHLRLVYSPAFEAVKVLAYGNIIATSKYIHELQNIVSALTREYLQLKNQQA